MSQRVKNLLERELDRKQEKISTEEANLRRQREALGEALRNKPNITSLEYIARASTRLHGTYLNAFFPHFPGKHVISELDEKLHRTLLNLFNVSAIEDVKRSYELCRTGGKNTTDSQVIYYQEVAKSLTLEEIFITTLVLIEEDLRGRGPLSYLDFSHQKTLTLGYLSPYLEDNSDPFDDLRAIDIERLGLTDEGKREYKLLSREVDKYTYSPHSHILIKRM